MDEELRRLQRLADQGDKAAQAALERLLQRSKRKYFFRDAGGEVTFWAKDDKEASRIAMRMARQGYEPAEETYWIDFWVEPEEEPNEAWQLTITVDPEEPGCINQDEHTWEEEHIRGNGGGVIVTEICRDCNRLRITNTWAYRRDTGEQGLHSVRYDLADVEEDEDLRELIIDDIRGLTYVVLDMLGSDGTWEIAEAMASELVRYRDRPAWGENWRPWLDEVASDGRWETELAAAEEEEDDED
jgi:hypothetical protein